jgi:hypothetical protein
MIMHRTIERTLVCTCCGEVLKVKLQDWNNPIAMRRLRREMDKEHEPCLEFEGNPERARAERIFQEGLKREFGSLHGD